MNKGPHTFFLILAGKQEIKSPALVEDALVQGRFKGVVYCLFPQANCQRRPVAISAARSIAISR